MRVTSFALFVVVWAGTGLSADDGAFQFSIPAGWTDLSPDAQASNFDGLPSEVVQEARSGKYAAVAFELGSTDGFAENMNARILDGTLGYEPIEEIVRQLEALDTGSPSSVVEAAYVTVAGVRCLKLVIDRDELGMKVRTLQYMMPGGNERYAVVSYASTPEMFESYRAQFEASVQRTVGLSAPQTAFDMDAVRDSFSKIGTWFLGFLIVVLVVRDRMKKAQAPPPRRGFPPRRPPQSR